jgi:DNA-binding GntR family transcriptional regulator
MKRKTGRRIKADTAADRAVYDTIRTALLGGRLPQGLKLQEPAIARALGASRERVRGTLRRLAHEGWLRLIPNRGAIVPAIERNEIAEVTAARILIEQSAIEQIARRREPADIARLRDHLALEARAKKAHRRAEQISLSSDFHRLLMELAGNSRLVRFHADLMQTSQLFYALYAELELPRCGGPDEHPQIVDAIEHGRAARATSLLAEHLEEVQRHLRTDVPRAAFISFADALGSNGAAKPARRVRNRPA